MTILLRCCWSTTTGPVWPVLTYLLRPRMGPQQRFNQRCHRRIVFDSELPHHGDNLVREFDQDLLQVKLSVSQIHPARRNTIAVDRPYPMHLCPCRFRLQHQTRKQRQATSDTGYVLNIRMHCTQWSCLAL